MANEPLHSVTAHGARLTRGMQQAEVYKANGWVRLLSVMFYAQFEIKETNV
jgi:hypothetical protein